MKELCPAEALHEECGVFGIYDSTGKTNMVSAVYSALYALQHRGQESCGIALNVDGVLTGYRDLGLVSEVFTPRVLADLPQNAKMATGHVRYATSGQRTRANAQPMVLHHCKGTMAICHNGNLTNAPQLRHKLEMNGSIFHGTSDTEVIGYLLTQNRLISPDIETAVCRTMEQIVGAYSLVIMTHTKLIAARDPNGFRPLCIGQLPDGSGWAFASESCALDAVGARFVRDVLPGEIVVADYTGLRTIRTHCGTAPHTMCVFEYIYFARPDSIIEGTCVHEARLQAGRFLAQEHPVEADVVIGAPDSGLDAAMGYARESGIPYGIGLIKNKLEEHGLASSAIFHEIRPRQKVTLGCFTVEPIHVNHSIPDSLAFAIDCPAGVVIHTGDFKVDYTPLSGDAVTDLPTIAEYGRRGVLALLADSTNAERPGFTATEQTVAEGVRRLFAKAGKRRIIVATFASNIYRVQQIIDLAIESGRKVAVSGRSMVSNTEMAKELGYLHAPDNVLITIDEINKYPPEKVVLITTGSQGEPLSALSRMAQASHRQVRVGPGDFIIISANPIPGNEKSVTKIVNGLLLLGAEVIYESMYDVHVSGHACQEEQKLMLTLTRPKYFLPVHGEYKQLKKHALTAASLGIPTSNILIAENGSNVILTKDEIKLGEPVTAGAVMVDGLGVGDVGNVVLRDRKHLSEDGLVIIVATVDSKTGKVLAGPDLVSRGFVYVRENESLMDGAQSIVENALDRCVEEHVRDWNSVKTRVREALSSYIYRRTKRSPMILPILMEV